MDASVLTDEIGAAKCRTTTTCSAPRVLHHGQRWPWSWSPAAVPRCRASRQAALALAERGDFFAVAAGGGAAVPAQFQAFFRARRPPTLIVWGRNDAIFPARGARAYLRALPDAELHLLDTGHFALEDIGEQIAALMREFLDHKLPRR
jgi:pimeloyl-ACP methyl ester carboxylesterase